MSENLFESMAYIKYFEISSIHMENIHEDIFNPIRESLEILKVNFPCVGYVTVDEKEDIIGLIETMKTSCFHPYYTANEL
jgi:hypothetical protein